MASYLRGLSIALLLSGAGPCLATGATADLNGDGAVDGADLDRMRAVFMTNDTTADLDGNGVVNYADLAILRSKTPGALPVPTAGVGVSPVISISPAGGSFSIGDQIETLISADFSSDPTVGGTFDIVYDSAVLTVLSVESLPLGDPDFLIHPVLLPGVVQQAGFGDFDGVVGGDVLRVTFEVIAPLDPLTDLADVFMRDGGLPGGPFFSVVTFMQQTVDYQGAAYDLPSAADYEFVGLTTGCTTDCDNYVALGGPGAANPTPSYLTGFVRIAATAGESFDTIDILGFRFELGNNAVPGDASGDPALANPYVIDATQATISGSGSISVGGVLDTGQLTLTLSTEPWLSDQAVLELNVDALQFTVTFDAGATVVANGEGGFVGQALPARILVAPQALDFGALEVGSNSSLDTIIQNLGLQDLDVGTIGSGDPLSPPFSLAGAIGSLYDYSSTVTLCTSTCDSFASLAVGTTITGQIEIDVAPGGSFGDAQVGDFLFSVFNPALPVSGPTGDPFTDNPLILDSTLGAAVSNGSAGTADGAGELDSGELLLEMLDPPFSSNGAFVVFDLSTGDGRLCLFFATAGCIPGATAAMVSMGDFNGTAVSCSDSALAPGETCEQSVRFAPEAVGVFNDSFDIPSSDSMNPQVTVNVTGDGFGIPNIQVSPSSLDFGETPVGVPVEAVVTVGNIGTGDLVLGAVGADDPLDVPFAVILDNCSGQTVAPAGTCTLTVEFAPQLAGNSSDTFSVSSNDPDQPVLLIDVAGRTGIPNISVTPELGGFGEVPVGGSASIDFTVSNTGTDVLVFGQTGTFDPVGDPFSVTLDTCTEQTLAPSGTCTITVEFAPLTGGLFGDALSIESNDPDEPIVLRLMAGRTPTQPAILDTSGTVGGLGLCRNVDNDQRVGRLLFGNPTLVCDSSVLPILPGDDLIVTVFGQVDGSGPITGSVSGITPTGAVCHNAEDGGQTIIELPTGVTDWDCTGAGFVAATGDRVFIVVRGLAD